MNVWVVNVHEPVPLSGVHTDRLFRAGLLTRALIEQDHRVLWISSSFHHFIKAWRDDLEPGVSNEKGLDICLLKGLGYKKNVSLRRLLHNNVLGKEFARKISALPKPDIIFCALPILELANICVRFARLIGVPVIIDLRDMWPDNFLARVPTWMRGIAKIGMRPLYSSMTYLCQHADALTAINEDFLRWGLTYARRERHHNDRVFPLSCPIAKCCAQDHESAYEFWRAKGLLRENQVVVSFVGSLVARFELETVLQAAAHFDQSVQFVIAGDGDELGRLKALKTRLQLDNVIFPGWLGKDHIHVLLELSSIGLAPYKSTVDFMVSVPNKPIEYMGMGLPILSSLKGKLCELLNKNDCGLTYDNNNSQQLVSMLKSLLNDRVKLARMSDNARRLYQTAFDADRIYGDMVRLLETVQQEGKLQAKAANFS